MAESRGPNQKRLFLIAAAAIVVLWFGYGIIASWFESDEEKIRRTLESIRVAVEAKHARNVVYFLDDGYADAQGLSKPEIRANLNAYFLRAKGSLTCVIVPGEIDVDADGQKATATFRAAIYEGISIADLTANKGAARGQGFDFEIGMKKNQDGEWRITTHTRKPFPANDIYRLAIGGD